MAAAAEYPLYFQAPPPGAVAFPQAAYYGGVGGAPLGARYTTGKQDRVGNFLNFGETVSNVPLIPGGNAMGVLFGGLNGQHIKHKKKEDLLSDPGLRMIVAEKLGIPVQDLQAKHLREAAERFSELGFLKQTLEEIDGEARRRPVQAAVGAAGNAVGGLLGAAVGPIGTLAGGAAGGALFNKAYAMLAGSKDQPEALAAFEALKGKFERGESIDPLDVFSFYVARHPDTAMHIEERHAEPFASLPFESQIAVMAKTPMLTLPAAEATRLLNAGEITPAMLLCGDVQKEIADRVHAPVPHVAVLPACKVACPAVEQGVVASPRPTAEIHSPQTVGSFTQAIAQREAQAHFPGGHAPV